MEGASASPFRPHGVDDIAAFLQAHSDTSTPVVVRGGGSKMSLGRPVGNATSLDVGGIAGITLYEPEELVLTARAGTPVAEIAAVVAARGQHLAFDPPDFAALFGEEAGRSTFGGMVAAGLSGPRRIKAGAVRDHVLGACAVGGDGRLFKSGGRVVKNVTGFDLPKLLTGSHGTLAVMTEITVKVLPAPEETTTLLLTGLEPAAAIRILSGALGGPFDVSGAAHVPATAAARSTVAAVAKAGASVTALRLEGFGPSVADRKATLAAHLGPYGSILSLEAEECAAFWRDVRDVARLLDPDKIVWRLSLPPSDAASTVAAIARVETVEALYDWGGGLVWLALPPAEDAHAALVRGALPSGHATLFRAPAAIRAKVPVFQPQPPALAALARRVKAAFDPCGILSPGRMVAEI